VAQGAAQRADLFLRSGVANPLCLTFPLRHQTAISAPRSNDRSTSIVLKNCLIGARVADCLLLGCHSAQGLNADRLDKTLK
jgi:hypothetical protein